MSTGPSRSRAGYARRRASKSASASVSSLDSTAHSGLPSSNAATMPRASSAPPSPGVSTRASSSTCASASSPRCFHSSTAVRHSRSSSSSAYGVRPRRVTDGDRDAGVDEVVERADDGARRAGERRPQPQGDLGDDAERALRTDHQAAEVKSRNAFRGPATQPDRGAVAGGTAHDRPHTEDVVAGDAVLEAAQAAGVGRDVAADRRPRRARGVRRVPEALLAHERLEIVVDDAGLDDADEVVGVDLDDLVHPRQVEDEAAVDGVRAAGQAGARAPRDDRHAEVGADADRLLDLRLGARSQRRQRPSRPAPTRRRPRTGWPRTSRSVTSRCSGIVRDRASSSCGVVTSTVTPGPRARAPPWPARRERS